MPDNIGGGTVDGAGTVVNIYNPVVKDDMDIKKLSRQIGEELHKTQERSRRAKGVQPAY
jgi:hypothetical protein